MAQKKMYDRDRFRKKEMGILTKVHYETEGRIGVITVDSPPVNALDKELLNELSDTLIESGMISVQ